MSSKQLLTTGRDRKYLVFYGNPDSCRLIRMSEQIKEDFKDKNLMIVNVYSINNPVIIIRNRGGSEAHLFGGKTYEHLKQFIDGHL